MNTTSKEHRSCLRKAGLSKARADLAIDEWAARGIVMYYYLCKYCRMYHMTKSGQVLENGKYKKGKVKAKYRRR